MDGAGGTLKREADHAVLNGTDINDKAGFIKALSRVDIFLLEISSNAINNMK